MSGPGDRLTLVVLSRGGRTSLPPHHWLALDRVAEVRVVQRDGPPGEDEAAALLAGADLLGATNVCLPRLDDALLRRVPRLSGVVLYATGYELLDVAGLRRAGVGLSVLPDYATEAVAEHGVALLLALATRLHLASDRSRGRVDPAVSLRGVELRGRTLGVLGLGRIGARTATLGSALGMHVLGTDPDPAACARALGEGVEVVGQDELLHRSQSLVICASSGYCAPPLLGDAELGCLPPGALLVNVARASLVDMAAAARALRARTLRGYAVDDVVVDPTVDGDLLDEGRLLQSGHSAWWRDEVLERGAAMWGERLLAAAVGRPVDAVTWPGAGGAPRTRAHEVEMSQ